MGFWRMVALWAIVAIMGTFGAVGAAEASDLAGETCRGGKCGSRIVERTRKVERKTGQGTRTAFRWIFRR